MTDAQMLRTAVAACAVDIQARIRDLSDEVAILAEMADHEGEALARHLRVMAGEWVRELAEADPVLGAILDAEAAAIVTPDPAGDYADYRHAQRVEDLIMGARHG